VFRLRLFNSMALLGATYHRAAIVDGILNKLFKPALEKRLDGNF
jgi:hypothetical protein